MFIKDNKCKNNKNQIMKLTCPRSIVTLTSLYFIPLESGGLCHHLSVPSMAYSAGWEPGVQ